MSESTNLTPELQSVLLEIIRQETSPEASQARAQILRRMALEGDVVPSRIPAPLNITQIGGYINLLERNGHDDLSYRLLASTLGLPTSNIESKLYQTQPVQFFVQLDGDRPTCAQMPSFPLSFAIRSDFRPAFAAVQRIFHEAGAGIPFVNTRRALPELDEPLPELTRALDIIGRCLDIASFAAVVDPEKDPVIIAREADGSGAIFGRAGHAVALSTHDAYVITEEGALDTVSVSGPFIYLTPLLNQAGWFSSYGIEEHPLLMLRLRNTTGLMPGLSTYGNELSLLYTRAQIVASCVRDMLDWVWNGQAFVAP